MTSTVYSAAYSDFAITGDAVISEAGTYNYTHTNSVQTPRYTKYELNGHNGYNSSWTYYSTNDNETASTSSPAGTTVTTGYVWSLSGGEGYATVNASTGSITVSSLPSGTIEMTLTCTLNGTKTAEMTVTLTNAVSENAGYVIYDGNNHYLSGTNGTTSLQTFAPSSCLWTFSNSKFTNSGNYLRLIYSSRTYSLNVSSSNSRNTITLSGTELGTTGQKIQVAYSESYKRYVRYNNGWTVTNTAGDNGTNIVFAVTKVTFPANEVAPAISGDNTFASTGSKTYTHSDAAYTMGYIDYIFYNNTDHYFKSDNTTSLSAVPTAETFTYTWSLSANAAGHVTVNASTGVVSYDSYYADDTDVTLTLTATSASKTFTINKTIRFEAPKVNPTGIAITSDNPMTLYVGTSAPVTYTLTPSPCYNNVSYQSANAGIAAVSNGTVTGVVVGQTTITLTAKKLDGTAAASATVTVNVRDVVATPSIAFAPVSDGAQATATISCSTPGAAIYYTTDGSTPTTGSTPYNGAFTVSDQAVVKAIAAMPGNAYYDNSAVASLQYSRCTSAEPAININGGEVTFSSPEGDVTFYYTTDGSTPTTGSTSWTSSSAAITGLANESTIKVIAKSGQCQPSAVVSRQYLVTSGVSGTTVTLNDLEDHNWKYYAGEETTVGNTNQTYKDKYRYTLYSPDPRNVKITYNGVDLSGNLGSNVKVSPTEAQNQFVYYKTVEKYMIGFFTDADGTAIPNDATNANEQYAYTVISNPFSVRPSSGSTYYGFAGWKIVSGAKYIGRGANRAQASNGDVLDLDEIIHFINLDSDVPYTPNCISAEIVLEATWTAATVKTGTSAQTFTGGTYETNFIVASGNISSITQSYPCTIIGMYPDGSSNNSASRTITGLKVNTSGTTSATNTVKVEYIRHGNGTFDANGKNLTLGRGITSSSSSGNGAQGSIYGRNGANINCVNTVKVESGYYSSLSNLSNHTSTSSTKVNCYTIMGCDYDRALANYYVPASEVNNNAYNIKLRIARIFGTAGANPDQSRAAGQLYIRSLIKSGCLTVTTSTSVSSREYYFHSYKHRGQRYIEMEGGYIGGNIKGGSEGTESQVGKRAMSLRIRNGRVDDQIGCGSTSNPCSGDRVVVITGGRFGGWIAPGSNCSSGGSGSDDTTGFTNGTSYVYFGGTAEINSRQFGTTPRMFYQSTGGVIYGSGLGYKTTDRTGEMAGGSNIVFADEAYTERGIYGGGAVGQTLTDANIFILGGRVGTGQGEIKNQGTGTTYTVEAGVYGGACYRGGENSFIYMSGGVVESGIYGGSNIDGTMSGNTNLRIVGGQVGTTTLEANIHGGGYGAGTGVTGNVDVTLGNADEAADSVVVYGDVYGGSALGKVNGTASDASKHTIVTMNHGLVHGDIYGGGLGDASNAANVYGAVTVNIHGGAAERVFGCNNTNGRPMQNTNHVNMDGGTVGYIYGGGNAAAYTGTPYVDMAGGKVTEHVFGGGLGANAVITGSTNVTIRDHANVLKNVYGGGNAAQVTGDTFVKIK